MKASMVPKFDDEVALILHGLKNRARALSDVLFDFGKELTSSDELYELDKRQQQLNELYKLIKKLEDGTN